MRFSEGRCVVIAEAGVNHNGSIEIARQLATAAQFAGADFVKFQTFVPSLVASHAAPAAPYQSDAGFTSQQPMLEDLLLSDQDHRSLKSHCEEIGIGFLSTGHDLDSARYLEGLGQAFVKVGSGDLTNWQLLDAVAGFGKTILLSTGASSWEDVESTVRFLEKLGFSVRDSLVLLQCTSAYPAPSEEANIRVLSRYKSEFGCKVGFSDHTLDLEAALAAVSLGAVVIEKHITLDTNLVGPDHKSSLDPSQFRDYLDSIRRLEHALGTDEKHVTPSEVKNQPIIRKGLYSRVKISAGEKLTGENVIAKRPVSGCDASLWPIVEGLISHRDYEPDEPLEAPR